MNAAPRCSLVDKGKGNRMTEMFEGRQLEDLHRGGSREEAKGLMSRNGARVLITTARLQDVLGCLSLRAEGGVVVGVIEDEQAVRRKGRRRKDEYKRGEDDRHRGGDKEEEEEKRGRQGGRGGEGRKNWVGIEDGVHYGVSDEADKARLVWQYTHYHPNVPPPRTAHARQPNHYFTVQLRHCSHGNGCGKYSPCHLK